MHARMVSLIVFSMYSHVGTRGLAGDGLVILAFVYPCVRRESVEPVMSVCVERAYTMVCPTRLQFLELFDIARGLSSECMFVCA